MIELTTSTTRWAARMGLGNVGVLHYYAPENESYYSDYFSESVYTGQKVYSDERYIYIYNDNGTLKLYDMINIKSDNMISFEPGVEINGIKIHKIESNSIPMFPGKPWLGLYDESFKVSFEFADSE